MNLFQMFGTSESLEKDGIEIQYGENSKGKDIVFKIARAGGSNAEFNKAMERLTKPYRRHIQQGTLDNKVADDIYRTAFIDAVLLGWEGVEDQNGKDIPFTKEAAHELFKSLPELFNDLRDQASNMALFRKENLDADVKNSGQS